MKHSPLTIQLRFPTGQTLALALLILALIGAAAELGARVLLDRADTPAALGSANPALDVKMGMVDRLDRVDCIFLGSSVVYHGLDPAVFEPAYRDQTGQAFTCYNFGVPAMTARAAGVLAEVLVERYHPRLLIYGFTLRAMAEGSADAALIYRDITRTPWIAYRRGELNPLGWLVDHSAALRYYLAYRNWARVDFSLQVNMYTRAPANGYQSYIGARETADLSAIQAPDYFAHFVLSPVEFDGLAQIVALQGRTAVLLVEMPLPDPVIDQFDGGVAAHRAIFGDFARYAQAHGATFISANHQGLIPDEGWAEDGLHVNRAGAQILSAWLGQRVGAAVAGGDFVFPAW